MGSTPPDDEAHGRVHTAQEAVRAEPLTEADLVHVVDDHEERHDHEAHAEEREADAGHGQRHQEPSDAAGDADERGSGAAESSGDGSRGDRAEHASHTPRLNRSPITPGDACTSRTKKTISTAAAMPLKKFEVAVVAAMARNSVWANTKRSPSRDVVEEAWVPFVGDDRLGFRGADGAHRDGGHQETGGVERDRG